MLREGAREDGTFYVISQAPDVCKTPIGAVMTPTPYPIVGKLSDVAGIAPTVRMRGKATFTTTSQVTRVMGDEAGVGGGVVSGVNMSICESITASTTVRAEANWVLRDGDLMKMNNGNTIGKIVYAPGPAGSDGGGPEGALDQAKDDFVDDVKGFFKGWAKKTIMGPAYSLATDGPPVPNPDAILQHLRDAKAKGGWWRVGGSVVYMGAKYVVMERAGELTIEKLGTPSFDAAATTEMDAATTTKMKAASPDDPDAASTAKMKAASPEELDAAATNKMNPARPLKSVAAGDGFTVTGAGDTQPIQQRIIYFGDADAALDAAMKVTPEPGLMDIDVHANRNGFGIKENGAWRTVSVKELADYVRTFGPPPPGGYRLVACEAGADVGGPAQQLANELGAPVWAPDKTVSNYSNGKLYSGTKADSSGRFRQFTPGGESPFIESE